MALNRNGTFAPATILIIGITSTIAAFYVPNPASAVYAWIGGGALGAGIIMFVVNKMLTGTYWG